MFLTKYRPSALDSWFDTDFFPSLSKFFEVEGEGKEVFRLPMTNIRETDKSYVLTMEMPGVDKKNVKVGIEDDELIVRGESTEKVNDDNKGLIRREIRSKKFQRSFSLGRTIDRDNIKAKMENGILTVTLPKAAQSVGREVAID